MTWYKQSQVQHPQSLEDRNVINETIRFLEAAKDHVEDLAKVVFQSGYAAKGEAFKLAMDKKMTSYPRLQDLLLEADKTALDSPWRFADICYDVSDELVKRIRQAQKVRKNLIEETLPNKMKGWVERHGR